MKYVLFILSFILSFQLLTAQPYAIEKIKEISTKQYDEFSPYFYPGGLLYCSNKYRSFFYRIMDSTGNAFIDLYFVTLTDSSIGKPILFAEPITTLAHEGPAWLSNDGRLMYYTRNIYIDIFTMNEYKQKYKINPLGIFISEFRGYYWIQPKPFKWNYEEYNVMHPTLSKDNKTIIFSSNIPGGQGGYDLYVSYYNQKGWSKPINLGPNINTKNNEAFPFLHPSGRLYFARKDSNNLNIYFSSKYNDEWIKAQKIFFPINTIYDDFSLIWNENFTLGFFTSNRDGSDDIYRIKSTNPVFINCKFLREELYCYKLGTMNLKKEINDSTHFEWDFGDGLFDTNYIVNHCYRPGTYHIKLYKIINEKHLLYSSDTLEVKSDIPVLNLPDKCVVGTEITCDASAFEDLKDEKFYWWWGDGTIDTTATVSHVFKEPGIYDFRFVLEGKDIKTQEPNKTCLYRTIWVK